MRALFFLLMGWVVALQCGAATIAEDFSSNPLQHGWEIFGDTNLFQWDSTNQDLAVTWDSSQSNSYFHHPLGTVVTRNDDFSIGFDLRIKDVGPGSDPGKTGPFELAVGLLNLGEATRTNFLRGTGSGSPDLVEFDYFFAGYYPGYPFLISATTMPVFVSNRNKFAPVDYSSYEQELPLDETVRISMSYTAENQTLVMQITTTNGFPLFTVPDVVLTNIYGSQFTALDDFRVDTISVSSYSDTGAFGSSILSHGTVANLAVSVPPPPIQNMRGAFSGGIWQVQFLSRTNWLYTLERTTNAQTWSGVSDAFPGNGTNLVLEDNPPTESQALYRIRATRP
jgi:hypothetical protein